MTNLLSINNNLLEMQSALDLSIINSEKVGGNFTTMDELWTYRKLALLVEVSEVINEVRPFKYWSNKGRSSAEVILEELSDVLHFVLSLVLTYHSTKSIYREYRDIDESKIILGRYSYDYQLDYSGTPEATTLSSNLLITEKTLSFISYVSNSSLYSSTSDYIDQLLSEYWEFVISLGYTIEDVYEAYLSKNEENYRRLESGY